jgi:hypothetical protein
MRSEATDASAQQPAPSHNRSDKLFDVAFLANNWSLGNRPDLGAINQLCGMLRELDIRDAAALPRLRDASHLLLASDYSGQHSTSCFESYSFLLVDGGQLGPWLNAREAFRRHSLPDSRRLSFKALNDVHRARALPRFLRISEQLVGLLFVALIDKRLGSLFDREIDQPLSELEMRLKNEWPAKSQEKLLRICHLASLLLAGLSSKFQNVLWVTDQDDVAANEQMHRDLVQAFARVASHYLEHSLGHVRLATTASDTGRRDLEDFVAIADLAAGATCHVFNVQRASNTDLPLGVDMLPPAGMTGKVVNLMNWFSDQRSSLKRVVVAIGPGESAPKLRLRHIDFFGTSGLGPAKTALDSGCGPRPPKSEWANRVWRRRPSDR